MTKSAPEKLEAVRTGQEPRLICRIPSGYVFLCGNQYLHGYCILQADPVVESINSLDASQRAAFLCDMALVGDAIMEVTGSYRINYAIFGNSLPILHAHIIPRFLDEPDEFRKDNPWSYPSFNDGSIPFDPVRDAGLISDLRINIQHRMEASHSDENIPQ
jgi:diadenosine tetraphosphate (Ap4A) HIT family hydrolase